MEKPITAQLYSNGTPVGEPKHISYGWLRRRRNRELVWESFGESAVVDELVLTYPNGDRVSTPITAPQFIHPLDVVHLDGIQLDDP